MTTSEDTVPELAQRMGLSQDTIRQTIAYLRGSFPTIGSRVRFLGFGGGEGTVTDMERFSGPTPSLDIRVEWDDGRKSWFTWGVGPWGTQVELVR